MKPGTIAGHGRPVAHVGRRLFSWSLALIGAVLAASQAQASRPSGTPAAAAPGPAPANAGFECLRPVNAAQAAPDFAFESAFWRNLHHTLYAFANSRWSAGRRPQIRLREEDVAIVDGLPPDARARWAAAVGWYIAHLADRDLRIDDELREAGRTLSAADADSDLRGVGLPAGMRDVLNSVAADYRAHLWPGHSAVNARWRAQLEPLLSHYGPRVAARLACAFGSEWPSHPVPVTLTPYAKPLGAYTSLDPTLVTMVTSDSRYQGVAAFEMLMHEVSHELIFPLRERLSAAIAAVAGGSRPGFPHLQIELHHEGDGQRGTDPRAIQRNPSGMR